VLLLESSHIKNRLKEALQKELPGETAHRKMLPKGRNLYPEAGKANMIQSSVLMLIFPHNEELNTCLIRRPSNMRNHGGQIAFPGGRYEPSDNDLVQTALRESFEEIGLNDHQLEVIGSLSPIYVQVSNFTINPFIGWCQTSPRFNIDHREVDELFLIPIEKLLHPSTIRSKEVSTLRGTFVVPGFYLDQIFIWGATAMIISEFNQIYDSVRGL
jgi:8-oxo-dGTP pyrophosphatase MutT (NUDIX family)